MDERLKAWRPTQDEVERILDEMRPIIRALARRGGAAVATTIAPRPDPVSR